jgi:hypothetical protein
LENNINNRFLLVYSMILSIINLFIISSWIIISVRFYPYGFHYSFIFLSIVQYIILSFYILYFIELIISIIFVGKYITRKNIRNIIPQIVISSFYIFIFIHIIFLPGWFDSIRQFDKIKIGLPFLLVSISLAFSHLLVTGYIKSNKIKIFWKIMSSLTSFLLLFTWIGMASSV